MRTRHIGSSSDLVPSNKTPASGKPDSGKHQSVLLQEAIDILSIKPTDTVVDATLGGAGHARVIADLLEDNGTLVGFDLDEDAIVRAQVALANVSPRIFLIESNFRNIEAELTTRGVTTIDKALYDLGWSAFQLEAGRGFSFLKDEPLLMTYGKGSDKAGLTAARRIYCRHYLRLGRGTVFTPHRARHRGAAQSTTVHTGDRSRGGDQVSGTGGLSTWSIAPGDPHLPGLANRSQ
jgi:hypothetical protein